MRPRRDWGASTAKEKRTSRWIRKYPRLKHHPSHMGDTVTISANATRVWTALLHTRASAICQLPTAR